MILFCCYTRTNKKIITDNFNKPFSWGKNCASEALGGKSDG